MILTRIKQDAVCTLGKLVSRDGKFSCVTLEPPSPMPAGTYTVVKYDSPRFKRVVPLLQNVPGHDHIELHMGNTAADTHDCVLVGEDYDGDAITHSVATLDRLMTYLDDVDTWQLTITDPS